MLRSWTVLLVVVTAQDLVRGTPLGRRQLCGRELADTLSSICFDRGYNDPFSTSPGTEVPMYVRSRTTRGVADECCKTGCTWSTLEQYCNPRPPETSRSPQSQLSTEKHTSILRNTLESSLEASSSSSSSSSSSKRRSSSRMSKKKKKDRKHDPSGKVRGHHKKKGRRGNNRCRCRRRRRRGKVEVAENAEENANKIPPVIGTISPAYMRVPIVLLKRKAQDTAQN